jgi:hypothetical protein
MRQVGSAVLSAKSGCRHAERWKSAEIGSMTNLYDHRGHRKHLTPAEREAFLKAADEAER